MKFVMNTLLWTIEYTEDESVLSTADGMVFGGITDPLELKVYIRKGMKSALTYQIVIHELTHCAMFSYAHRDGIETFNEEQICDFFGCFGNEIISTAKQFILPSNS